MNLRNRLEGELNQLASQGAGGSAGRIHIDCGDGRFEAELLAVEAIGCRFRHVTYHTDKLSGASTDELRQLGEDVSSRLTYLLEPIRPCEVDEESCVLQLRSSPPAKDDDGTRYYELIVRRGGELSLCRYQKTPGKTREVVPAEVSREVLCRMADDFRAAVP